MFSLILCLHPCLCLVIPQKSTSFKLQVPASKEQIIAKEVRTALELITGDNIKISEKYGNTVVSNLKKGNTNPKPSCHRSNCKPCHHGMKDCTCFDVNIGYRIVCNRFPCNSNIKMTQRDLDTNNFRLQLDKLTPGQARPATYEGESYRSSYSRSLVHWGNYNTQSGQPKSFMFHHANEFHDCIIGKDRGTDDYIFVRTGKFTSNLDRLVDEGKRQTVFESYQRQNKVIVLNSKIDYVQPMRTQLTVITKSANSAPGRQDNFVPVIPLQSRDDPTPQHDRQIHPPQHQRKLAEGRRHIRQPPEPPPNLSYR